MKKTAGFIPTLLLAAAAAFGFDGGAKAQEVSTQSALENCARDMKAAFRPDMSDKEFQKMAETLEACIDRALPEEFDQGKINKNIKQAARAAGMDSKTQDFFTLFGSEVMKKRGAKKFFKAITPDREPSDLDTILEEEGKPPRQPQLRIPGLRQWKV